MLKNTIASNVKNTRLKRKISRAKMAQGLQITVSGYSRMERGEVEFSVTRLINISRLLGVSVSQLVEESN